MIEYGRYHFKKNLHFALIFLLLWVPTVPYLVYVVWIYPIKVPVRLLCQIK